MPFDITALTSFWLFANSVIVSISLHIYRISQKNKERSTSQSFINSKKSVADFEEHPQQRGTKRETVRYAISDPHGAYTLVMRILEKIRFGDTDTLYIGGDMIDKGENSLRLLQFALESPNVHPILGNHEYDLIKRYRAMMRAETSDFSAVLDSLRAGFLPHECERLDWETLDALSELPAYIEAADFIMVHAGLPLDCAGYPLPLTEASIESLLYDRRFLSPSLIQRGEKCILFGHTETTVIADTPRILAYRRDKSRPAHALADYHKIHLDTGVFSHGVLGCLCLDTLHSYYVSK